MANTLAVNAVEQGTNQFQGMYSEMWKVSMSVTDTDAVAINDTAAITFTVPGVVAGDHVVSWGSTLDLSDGTDQATILFLVTAANTVTMYIQADVGEFAADALNGAVFKLVVGRPSW